MTTFTIDTDKVEGLQPLLDELVAVPLAMFKVRKDGIDTGVVMDGGWGMANHTMKFDLSAGTKFFTHKTLSRRALTRLFGRDAWVRGVNN